MDDEEILERLHRLQGDLEYLEAGVTDPNIEVRLRNMQGALYATVQWVKAGMKGDTDARA